MTSSLIKICKDIIKKIVKIHEEKYKVVTIYIFSVAIFSSIIIAFLISNIKS